MKQLNIYRIVKTKWRQTAFDGEGARRFGGRWNSKGKLCVYTASSESLAILEILVHLQDVALLDSYSLIRLTISQDKVMIPESLPKNWKKYPAPSDTALLGDQWLKSNLSLALCVPSVIVPREKNYLINPSHPDFKVLPETAEELPFEFDSRLF